MHRRTLAVLLYLLPTIAFAIPPITRHVPPMGIEVPSDVQERTLQRLSNLSDQLQKYEFHPLAADVDVLLKAVRFAVKHRELYKLDHIKLLAGTLDLAAERLEKIAANNPDWLNNPLTVRGFYVRRDAWQRQTDALPLIDELFAAQQQRLAARAWRLAHNGAPDLAVLLAASLRKQRTLDPLAQRALQLLEREFTAAEPRAELEAAEAFADLADDVSGNLKRLRQAEPELTEFLARFAGTRAAKRAEAWLALRS